MPTSFDDAPLELIDQIVYESAGQPLNKLQRLVLEECWGTAKKTYEEIATRNNYSNGYIQQRVAPELWRILSIAVDTKVNKSNVRDVLIKHFEKMSKKDTVESSEETESSEALDTSDAVETIEDNNVADEQEQLLQVEEIAEYIEQDLELPIESVPLSSPFYIRRDPDETLCYDQVIQPGALIRIKAPRQMGKTSLARRILASTVGFRSVMINCQESDRATLSDINTLLRWFCTNLTLQLKLTPALNNFWDEDVGSKMSCTLYVEDYLLRTIDAPIVLVIDEASELFDYPEVAKDFFTMLRTWHEYTKYDEMWRHLRLVLVQSTESYLPLDINQSPFNVGTEVALKGFSHEQMTRLVHLHGLDLDADAYDQMFSLLAGHPHLSRLALYHLAKGTVSWEQMLATAGTDEGIFSNHLHRHLWNLQRYRELGVAFQKVLDQGGLANLNQVQGFKLASMGLVTIQKNKVQVSCDLYRQYFSKRLPISLV